jgi:hypothetical protein
MASTPDGRGYWLVAADGGVFAFGDAGFYGSTGNLHLNQPIVGLAATPDGAGYLMVASDGGVFAFGDAAFAGRLDSVSAVVGVATDPSGPGYWEVAQDGTVGSYGGAPIEPNVIGPGHVVGLYAVGSDFGMPPPPVVNSAATVTADVQAIVATLPAALTPPGWSWQVVPSLAEDINGVTVADTGQTDWGDPPLSQFSMASFSGLTPSQMAVNVWHEWANAVVMSRVQTTDWQSVPTSEVSWAASWAAAALPSLAGTTSGCEIIDLASDSLTAALGGPALGGCGGTTTAALDAQLLADIQSTPPGYAS